MLDKIPQVFISYSWTNDEYKEKVISLSTRLRHDGVDVKLDVWDLKEGQDVNVYMEQCVTNPEIDRVLILSDHVYADKADKRKGGVGKETTIISAEVYENADQHKFIPVVMERDNEGNVYLPSYLKSRVYRDLSGEDYEAEYEALLRLIYDVPTYRKPEIGKRPDWLTEERPDGLFKLRENIKSINSAALGKPKEEAARDFIDSYINAMKQFYVKSIDKDTYLSNFGKLKDYRDLFLDHLRALSATDHFGGLVADEFETLYNTLYNVNTYEPSAMSCTDTDFDIFRLHIWELFICTVAFMLHFERYADLNELLAHTFFLRDSGLGNHKRASSYHEFYYYSRMMEDVIKPGMDGELSRKYTLTGHYIKTQREYLPIYSANNIANADLFLYQVYNGLGLEKITDWSTWFPSLYVYVEEYDSMWKRLASKHFCEKIMPIFGVNTIESLKDKISKCVYDNNYKYSGSWNAAPAILSWIKLDDIATLP